MAGEREQGEGSPQRFTDQQLHMTARLYYSDGLPQADVARLMRVSQPQISRMLAEARLRSIVQIHVADYDPRDRGMEKNLRSQLGLQEAIVIRATSGLATEDVRHTVGHFAGPFLTKLLMPARTVAIAGGRTLATVIRFLKPPPARLELTILQAMGQIGAVADQCDAQELGRMLVTSLGGTCQMLNAPAFLPDARTRNTIASLEQIDEVKQKLRKADVALVGVGTPQNSVFVERQVLAPADFAKLLKSGAVGEICGRYFDSAGQECVTPMRERVISIELEELRNVPNVIAVVSGADRADAIMASLRGGLVKSLIIDDALGNALLGLAAQDKSALQRKRKGK